MDYREEIHLRAVIQWWRKRHPHCQNVMIRNGFVHAFDTQSRKVVLRLYAEIEKAYNEAKDA
jgi:hypothetical protein